MDGLIQDTIVSLRTRGGQFRRCKCAALKPSDFEELVRRTLSLSYTFASVHKWLQTKLAKPPCKSASYYTMQLIRDEARRVSGQRNAPVVVDGEVR